MSYRGLSILLLLGLACGSVHPITEAPYISLEQGVDGVRLDGFPSAIVDSLNWNDLASAENRKVGEEFQIAIKSDIQPYHLFRITNNRKDPGETVLFWPKPEFQIGLDPDENMRDYLNGMCDEFRETNMYEFCIPQFSREANWRSTFSNLVNQKIWSIPDGIVFEENSEESSNNWSMIYEIRAGMNYRTFQHNNPDSYASSAEALNIMAMAAQLRQIAVNFTPAQNYNIYEGITSGTKGSAFVPCNSEETWRFDGEIAELTSEFGLPMTVVDQDNIRFLVKLEGTIRDEWYAQRNSTGFTKVITPNQINSITVTTATRCNK
ncbi:MAG: hypothetical protein ACPGGA_11900 [Balneolaceae bacterium]